MTTSEPQPGRSATPREPSTGATAGEDEGKTADTRLQLTVLAILLASYAALAFASAFFISPEQVLSMGSQVPAFLTTAPHWLVGLAGAGVILAIYSPMGLAGWWFARKLGIPPLLRPGAGWRGWLAGPLVIGLVVGALLVAVDRAFVTGGSPLRIPHPLFPFSLIASAGAAIGEEILFRSFQMGLWAVLLNFLLRHRARPAALWAGNTIGALLFGAAHLPAVMLFLHVADARAVPGIALAETFLLNGIVGFVAGERYMRQGLIAAVGVHFWADVVWHVVWPVLSSGAPRPL